MKKKSKDLTPEQAELRRRAEQLLAEKEAGRATPQTREDEARLVHELQVHQIELELQNEELLESRRLAEAATEKYADLYDFAPVSYLMLDGQGVIKVANLTAATVLGIERSQLIGRRFGIFLTPETRPALNAFLDEVSKAEARSTCEAVLLGSGGAARNVRLDGTAIVSGGESGALYRVAMMDNAPAKWAEEAAAALALAEETERKRLEAVLDVLPVGVSILDRQGGVLLTNAAFEWVWSGPLPATLSVDDYRAYKAWWGDTGEPVAPEEWAAAVALREKRAVSGQLIEIQRFDGTRGFVINSAAPVLDAAGNIAGATVAIQDITALRRAEEALARERANLQAVFDVVNVGLLLADETGTVKRVNNTLARWVNASLPAREGIQPGDFVGCIHALAEPEGCGQTPHCSACRIRSTFETALRTGQSVHDVEAEATLSVDGQPLELWLEVSADPLVLDGQPHVILAMNNITARKQAEEALSDSEDMLASAEEIANVGSWQWDIGSGKVVWSDQMYRIFGAEPGEFTPTLDVFLERIAPEDRQRVSDTTAQAVAAGTSFDIEYAIPGLGAEVRYIYAQGEVLCDPLGHATNVMGTALDITERKQAEAALRASEERLATLFRASPTGIFVTRLADGLFYDLNDAYLDIIGYSREETIGHTSLELDLWMNPEDRDRVVDRIREQGRADGIEIRFRHKSGEMVDLLVSALPLNLSGQACILGTLTDITERKQTENALRFLVAAGREPSGEDFFQALARYLARSLGMDFVCIDRLQEGLLAADTVAVYFDGEFEDNLSYTLKDTPCGDVVKESVCCVTSGVRHLFPKDAVLQEMLAESYVGTILWSSNGQPIGLIAVIGRKPLSNPKLATSILQLVAVRAAGEMERREAEKALRKAHERLVVAQQAAGAGLWDWDMTTGRLDWSPELFRLFCLERATTEATFEVWRNAIHPDDRRIAQERIEKAIADHAPLVSEYRIMIPDGKVRWINALGDTTYDEQGRPVRMTGICLDITPRVKNEIELRKLNRALRARTHSNLALLRAVSESEYLDDVCRIVKEDCGHAMVWVGIAEDDEDKTVRPVASAGFDEGYLDTLKVTWADTEHGRGPTGTAIRRGKPCGCRNMVTDPAFTPWREEAVRRGYASSLVLPLMDEDRAFGAITIYATEPEAFSEEEAGLLLQLAGDLAFGITALRLRAAHAQATASLALNEERYRSLFNGMTEGFALHEIITDDDGAPCDYRFIEVNPAFERLTGLKASDIVGRTHNEVLPDDSRRWVEAYGNVALTGEPTHFEDYAAPLDRWYEVFSYRPAPRQFAVIFMDVTQRKQAEADIRKHVEELNAANEDLSRFNRVAVGRELRMIELKRQVNQLCAEAGQPPPYPLDFE